MFCFAGYEGPICNDTVDYCAYSNCANSEPCVNIVEEMRGVCLCGALKAPVHCSKSTTQQTSLPYVCLEKMKTIEKSSLMSVQKKTANDYEIFLCVSFHLTSFLCPSKTLTEFYIVSMMTII